MEIIEWKNITEVKNSLGSLNSRIEMTEERVSEFEGRSIEITKFLQQRE